MTQNMLIIGLTGSIGMGKSTAADILRGFNLPVYDADAVVHSLLRKGGKGVKPVAKLFPEAFRQGAIDRRILGKLVFDRPRKLRQLENLLHPLLKEIEVKFLKIARRKKAPAAILDIPLLFETGAYKRCDIIFCVSAPKAIQKVRVMQRPGMTKERFKAILARQMPDREKRKRADYVIGTGKSRADTRRRLKKIIAGLTKG